MNSLLVFCCLPLVVYCQSRNYFFVPTMKAYNRMLCASGVPGTENPLVCPQRMQSMPSLQNVYPLEQAPPLFQSPNPIFMRPPILGERPNMVPMGAHYRSSSKQAYLVPIVSYRSPKREESAPKPPEEKPKKVYLIPWESRDAKPLVNYILVPDELLSPDAPLDTLDDKKRFEIKKSHSKNSHSNHSHDGHRRYKRPQRDRKRPEVYGKTKPKSKEFKRIQEHEVKHFRSVHSGHDSRDYDDSATE